MEEDSSTANGRDISSVNNAYRSWNRWWIRGLLAIGHLVLLIAAASLTPSGYFVQLGASVGFLHFVGTPCLWFLLWHAKTRKIVLLFCGLVAAQTGITALVALHYRAVDGVVKEVMAEAIQRQEQFQAEFAKFHIEQVFQMLTPGNEHRVEELPGLLEKIRGAEARLQEIQAEQQVWTQAAVKRVEAVSRQTGEEFRRGTEDEDSKKISEVMSNYLSSIEKLVVFLLDTRDAYRFTKTGIAFDRPQDADTYDKMLGSLATMEKQITQINNDRVREANTLLHQ